jgi:hypothetical protein
VRLKRAMNNLLRRRGYEVRRVVERPGAAFLVDARSILSRHRDQSQATVAALNDKYRSPVFGSVTVWDLLQRLAQCVDPGDSFLYCASQQVHVLQVVEGMLDDGVSDPDLLLAALIHDLGKLLLLTDEDPSNVVGMNSPIGTYADRTGFDNCIFHWNHDEFGYSRFKDHVPDHIAWLIRYHSIDLSECERLMDERDARYADRYLRVLAHYDHGTKSNYILPRRQIHEYRDLIEGAFPKPILF